MSLAGGPTGQKNDLAIIEVALFFRKELLGAAAAAAGGGSSDSSSSAAAAGASAAAQPVILVTNDNAQLQLAKSHGLPAFRLAGASEFEGALSNVIKAGGDLSSAVLRQLLAPSATAGCGRTMAQRSLQDDFDGAVACLKGLVEAYEDLSGVLGRVSLLASGAGPGQAAGALAEVQRLLQEHAHVQPFAPGQQQPAGSGRAGRVSVLEATMANLEALGHSVAAWEQRVHTHHTPSRVLKWAAPSGGRAPSAS
jgi:hypothetical protein